MAEESHPEVRGPIQWFETSKRWRWVHDARSQLRRQGLHPDCWEMSSATWAVVTPRQLLFEADGRQKEALWGIPVEFDDALSLGEIRLIPKLERFLGEIADDYAARVAAATLTSHGNEQ